MGSSPALVKKKRKQKTGTTSPEQGDDKKQRDTQMHESLAGENLQEGENNSAPAKKSFDAQTDEQINEAFESYYLRKMTSEFSDDLEAVRSADDFSDASFSMLMTALKQGGDCFSLDEKRAVLEANLPN